MEIVSNTFLEFHNISGDEFSCSQHILNQTQEQEIRNQKISVVSEMSYYDLTSTESIISLVLVAIVLVTVFVCVGMCCSGDARHRDPCCEPRGPRQRIYVGSDCGCA